MKRGDNDAETCRLNGWGVGTLLVGKASTGIITLLRITAIGEQGVLLACLANQYPDIPEPSFCYGHDDVGWNLRDREWKTSNGKMVFEHSTKGLKK